MAIKKGKENSSGKGLAGEKLAVKRFSGINTDVGKRHQRKIVEEKSSREKTGGEKTGDQKFG